MLTVKNLIRSSFIFIIFVCLVSPVFSAAKTKNKKIKLYNRIVIHDFETLSLKNRYKYYASIIPYTIAKYLNKQNKFIITNIPAELRNLRYRKSQLTPEQYGLQEKSIKDKPRMSDFIITGTSNMVITIDKNTGIKNKELAIVVKVLNVKKKKAVYIKKTSIEVGAFLKRTTDDLSSKITDLIVIMQAENRKPPKQPKSPYINFYYALQDISYGLEVGKFFLKGVYNNEYKDSELIKGYLLFNTIGIFGVSLNVEFFSTKSDRDSSNYKEIQNFAGTIGFHLSIPFSKYFQLTFAPGVGGTLTRFYYGGSSEQSSYLDRKSNYLYLDGSTYFNINVMPLQLRVGFSYKSIFMKDSFEMYTMFAGIGYNL